MRARVANSLLRWRDARHRRHLILRYSAVLLLLFLAHTYFSNLSSPLKLIPQTLSAIAMGYVVYSILAVRGFQHLAEYIDWAAVAEAAGPEGGASAGRGR